MNDRRLLLISLATALLGLSILSACSSTPTTGILETYDDTPIDAVYVLPFYTSSTMGLAPHRREELHHRYEAKLHQAFGDHPFDARDASALNALLQDDATVDDLTLRHSLFRHFQPHPHRQQPPMESRLVTQWASEASFAQATLLAVEIAYHSQGRCTVDPRDHHPSALLIIRGDRHESPPQCLTAHLRASLIDPHRGVPIWRHHGLVELRVDALEASMEDELISAVIAQTFFSDDADFLSLFRPH